MAATDARPIPKKNTAYRHYFAIRDNAGDLVTTWAGMDSERSLDGAAFADCTNEATEIGTSGCGYIDLTAAEMNTDCTVLKVTVTNTNALPYVVNLFPEDTGDICVDLVSILGHLLTQTGTQLADGFEHFFDAATPAITVADTMRGTDSAATDTKLLAYIQLLARSDAAITADNATELSEINADEGSGAGNYAATAGSLENQASMASVHTAQLTTIITDTNELQTNQGNWLTATGFSTHSAADAADACWDEAYADHTSAGTYGLLVGAAFEEV